MEYEENLLETSNALAARVQQGDQKAFHRLFDLFWDTMHTYAVALVQNRAVAEDLIQEVWIDYWKRSRTIDPTNIKGYLYKAIRYQCYNHLRDTKFTTTHIAVAETLAVAPVVCEQEDAAALTKQVNAILATLPPRCREIFTLSRINQLNNTEIATALHLSKRTVENQLSFALSKLRKELIVGSMFCMLYLFLT